MTTHELHLSDGTLLAILDGEEADGARGHLEECSQCGTRMERMEAQSRRVTALLDAADAEVTPEYDASFLARMQDPAADRGAPTPPARPSPALFSLKRAAVVVLLMGALTPQVRAWVGDGLSSVWRQLGLGEAAAPDVPTPASSAVTVSADVVPGLLTVRLEGSSSGPGGDAPMAPAEELRVRLVPAGGDAASARFLTGSGEIVVLRDGFAVRADADLALHLEVGVPPSIDTVAITVGGTELWRRAWTGTPATVDVP